MNAELQQFRLAAMEAINRMASREARLSREADARNDEPWGLAHDRAEVCLREAAEAVQRLGRE